MLKAPDCILGIMKMKDSDTVHFLRKSECSLFPLIPRHNGMPSLNIVCSTTPLFSTHYHTPDSA